MGRGVAVVTGGSAGVGRAVACELALRGYRIGLIARGNAGLTAALEDVRRRGSDGAIAVADVSSAPEVEAAAESIEARLGPIDVWINNAMVTVLAPFMDVDPAEFERVTAVTYHGVVHGTRSALARMLPRDRGHIVQVGSALAYRSIPLQAAYCGAKSAARGFTDSIRSELLHDQSQVRISMVHLPAINTPQFAWGRAKLPRQPQPVPPIFAPDVAAKAIADVIGQDCRELHVAASTLKAVVGTKVIPGLLDRYLAKEAYEGQQAEKALPRQRPDNLFDAADETRDYGAKGPFTEREKETSAAAFAARLWLGLRNALR